MPADQPGVYEGTLDPGTVYGKCYLNVSYATFDTADDDDDFPERRVPTTASLTLTPNVGGALLGADSEIIVVSAKTLTTTDGHFEFWCIDGSHSSLNPSGWNWNARLNVDGALINSFNFTPDSTNVDPINLGTFFSIKDASTGTVLLPGPPPSVEWVGDQLVVGGKIGPHLTGGGGSGGGTSTPLLVPVTYDKSSNTWPTLDTTLANNPAVTWHFIGGSVASPPPTTVSGTALWDRPLV